MRDATEALESLADQIGLGALGFDENGVCALVIGEDMEIFFQGQPGDDVLRLSGVLGDLDRERPALAGLLLELNAGNGANGPSAFAVDPETGEILLIRELALTEMTPETMLAAVEKFVERVDYWTKNLPQLTLVDTAPPKELSEDAVIFRE